MSDAINRERAEGIYCHWESYPPDCADIHDNLLVIERVNGDCTISTFKCARSEAKSIQSFLDQTLSQGTRPRPAAGKKKTFAVNCSA